MLLRNANNSNSAAFATSQGQL